MGGVTTVFDKRGGDAFEGTADDDADGEVDNVAAHDEGFEFAHRALPLVPETLDHDLRSLICGWFYFSRGAHFQHSRSAVKQVSPILTAGAELFQHRGQRGQREADQKDVRDSFEYC